MTLTTYSGTRRSRAMLAVTSIAAGILLLGCGGDDDAATTTAATEDTQAAEDDTGVDDTADDAVGPAIIVISGFEFTGPDSVPVGTTVEVRNNDAAPHTWTSSDGVFDSGSLAMGESFEFTFEEPGEYPFFCAIHPSMTGTITVID